MTKEHKKMFNYTLIEDNSATVNIEDFSMLMESKFPKNMDSIERLYIGIWGIDCSKVEETLAYLASSKLIDIKYISVEFMSSTVYNEVIKKLNKYNTKLSKFEWKLVPDENRNTILHQMKYTCNAAIDKYNAYAYEEPKCSKELPHGLYAASSHIGLIVVSVDEKFHSKPKYIDTLEMPNFREYKKVSIFNVREEYEAPISEQSARDILDVLFSRFSEIPEIEMSNYNKPTISLFEKIVEGNEDYKGKFSFTESSYSADDIFYSEELRKRDLLRLTYE